MATEIIRRVLCDPHLDEGVLQIEATIQRTIRVDGETWEIDLCGEDDKRVRDFMEWVGKYGRPVTPVSKGRPPRRLLRETPAEERFICPVKGCGREYLKANSLRKHAQDDHHSTLTTLEGRVTPWHCDVCPNAPLYFEAASGLTLHMRKLHPTQTRAATATADQAS